MTTLVLRQLTPTCCTASLVAKHITCCELQTRSCNVRSYLASYECSPCTWHFLVLVVCVKLIHFHLILMHCDCLSLFIILINLCNYIHLLELRGRPSVIVLFTSFQPFLSPLSSCVVTHYSRQKVGLVSMYKFINNQLHGPIYNKCTPTSITYTHTYIRVSHTGGWPAKKGGVPRRRSRGTLLGGNGLYQYLPRTLVKRRCNLSPRANGSSSCRLEKCAAHKHLYTNISSGILYQC